MSRKPDPKREARIADLIKKLSRAYQREYQEEYSEINLTFDQIEERAGKAGRKLSQEIQRDMVEQQEQKKQQNRSACACGVMARFKSRQPRSLVTTNGGFTYQRACYYCPSCQQTFAPLDKQMGLDSGSCSTQVRLWVAGLVGQLPFAQAATTLLMLTQVDLSAASVERRSVQIGTSLRQEQHQKGQQHRADCLPEPDRKRPQRLYIGMDGVYVPLREAWKKDKSAGELTCRYGECKSGVVYQAGQDKTGRDAKVRPRA